MPQLRLDHAITGICWRCCDAAPLLIGRRVVIVSLIWLGCPLHEQILFVVVQMNIQRLEAVEVQSTILAVVIMLHTAMCHS